MDETVPSCPRFLVVVCAYVGHGEWFTSGRLATRILPMSSAEFAKEVSRKLSNLNRFGHLERRLGANGREFEYRATLEIIRRSLETAPPLAPLTKGIDL